MEYAMQRLLHIFATKITPAQSMKLFTAPKSAKRSWTEHYLYLVAVSEACGGADNLVQDNIVHYADPAMRVSMLARLNLMRTDYLRQTEELALLRSQRRLNCVEKWAETSSTTCKVPSQTHASVIRAGKQGI